MISHRYFQLNEEQNAKERENTKSEEASGSCRVTREEKEKEDLGACE